MHFNEQALRELIKGVNTLPWACMIRRARGSLCDPVRPPGPQAHRRPAPCGSSHGLVLRLDELGYASSTRDNINAKRSFWVSRTDS